MDVQALTPPSRIEQMAPPPPMRRRIHVPTEPLLFAAVVLMITLAIAKALPQADGAPRDASSGSTTVVVHNSRV